MFSFVFLLCVSLFFVPSVVLVFFPGFATAAPAKEGNQHHAQKRREDSSTNAKKGEHCTTLGGGGENTTTRKGRGRKATPARRREEAVFFGWCCLHLLLLGDVFHLLLWRGAAVSLSFLWRCGEFLSRVVRLLASSMECVAFHSSSLVDATFPSRSVGWLSCYPISFVVAFLPWAALPSLSSFLGGTASFSLLLCSCQKRTDVMDVYCTCRREEEGKAPPPKRRRGGGSATTKNGRREHHPEGERRPRSTTQQRRREKQPH